MVKVGWLHRELGSHELISLTRQKELPGDDDMGLKTNTTDLYIGSIIDMTTSQQW